MKILKFILPIVLIFALACPTYAAFLPEYKVIGRELTVEKDENIVKNSIDGKDSQGKKQTKTFMMSDKTYIKLVLIPFLLLFMIGPTYLLIEHEIKIHKRKSHSQ